MDPQSPNMPSFELPSPAIESGAAGSIAERQPINAEPVEKAGHEQNIGGQGSIPSMPSLPTPATTPAPAATAPTASVLPVSSPAIAEDNDLIEKAWVDKAKEIVSKTKNDPFVQNKELNRFKADYIKKRYNKEVKLAED